HILNPEGDMTFEQALAKELTWLGSINGIIKADYFQGGESAPQSMEAAEKIEPFVPDEIWPRFTFTAEENRILESTGADIDKYVETIEKMGLDEMLEVYQNAYDRYKES